jgi:hypothetical protein
MKTYKFWNPEFVAVQLNNTGFENLDPDTCTAAELDAVEDSMRCSVSTHIKLNDDAQAEAVAGIITNEWNGDARYEEIK